MPTVCERRGGLTFYSLALGLWLLTSQSAPLGVRRRVRGVQIFQPAAGRLRRARSIESSIVCATIATRRSISSPRTRSRKCCTSAPTIRPARTPAKTTQDSAPKSLAQSVDPKTGRQTIPGALGADQSATLLDGGLALGPGRRGQEFRRSQRGVDGKQPRAQPRRPPSRSLPSLSHDAGGEIGRRGLQERIGRSTCSTIPRAEPG